MQPSSVVIGSSIRPGEAQAGQNVNEHTSSHSWTSLSMGISRRDYTVRCSTAVRIHLEHVESELGVAVPTEWPRVAGRHQAHTAKRHTRVASRIHMA